MKANVSKVMLMMAAVAMMSMSVKSFADSVKLFDAHPTYHTGKLTDPSAAINFDETSRVLDCGPGFTAYLSSTPDGNGPIVVDNYITVDNKNACQNAGGNDPYNCFSNFNHAYSGGGQEGWTEDGLDALQTYTPVNRIDISGLLQEGKHLVNFALMDYGWWSASSDIYLVTSCSVKGKVDICHKPGTAAEHDLNVSQSAVAAHLAHGDRLGACKE
jgi:hypothetical protein